MHLTVFLNCFQSAKLLVDLNFSKFLLQFESHQLLECFEMLMILEFFSQDLSMTLMNESMAFSNKHISDILEVSMNEIFLIRFLMNDFSSLLSLEIDCI